MAHIYLRAEPLSLQKAALIKWEHLLSPGLFLSKYKEYESSFSGKNGFKRIAPSGRKLWNIKI